MFQNNQTMILNSINSLDTNLESILFLALTITLFTSSLPL